jgi:hypothetical protein
MDRFYRYLTWIAAIVLVPSIMSVSAGESAPGSRARALNSFLAENPGARVYDEEAVVTYTGDLGATYLRIIGRNFAAAGGVRGGTWRETSQRL